MDSDLGSSIRIAELCALLEKKGAEGSLSEVIFALAANPEGDRTAELVRQRIMPTREKYRFRISQLGRGFSTGTEVEYSDPETLASALENRK